MVQQVLMQPVELALILLHGRLAEEILQVQRDYLLEIITSVLQMPMAVFSQRV